MAALRPQVLGSGGRAMILGNCKLVQMTAQHPNRNHLRTVRNGGGDEAWENNQTGVTDWGVERMGVEQL